MIDEMVFADAIHPGYAPSMIKVVKLGLNRFAIFYRDDKNNGKLVLEVYTIEDDKIVQEIKVSLTQEGVAYISADQLWGEEKLLVAYQTDDMLGHYKFIDLSNLGQIEILLEETIETKGTTDYFSVCCYDSTRFAIVYRYRKSVNEQSCGKFLKVDVSQFVYVDAASLRYEPFEFFMSSPIEINTSCPRVGKVLILYREELTEEGQYSIFDNHNHQRIFSARWFADNVAFIESYCVNDNLTLVAYRDGDGNGKLVNFRISWSMVSPTKVKDFNDYTPCESMIIHEGNIRHISIANVVGDEALIYFGDTIESISYETIVDLKQGEMLYYNMKFDRESWYVSAIPINDKIIHICRDGQMEAHSKGKIRLWNTPLKNTA